MRSETGKSDGLRIDVDGNLWCGWGGAGVDGAMIFNSAGKAIGHVVLAEKVSNVCFGGTRRSRLFITASRSVYSLWVNTQGVVGGGALRLNSRHCSVCSLAES